MTATEPQPAEPRRKCRWFRFSRWRLLILLAIFVVSGIWLSLWGFAFPKLPLSWTADYDKDRYNQIRRAIEADPQHLLGKSLDEAAKELHLENVRWDDFSFQELNTATRIYHFRGFALYLPLQFLPARMTPNGNEGWSRANLKRPGKPWLNGWKPFVEIDGIRDGKERMYRHAKAFNERLEREAEEEKQER